jgi:putative peptidoglycan lipid II flippase
VPVSPLPQDRQAARSKSGAIARAGAIVTAAYLASRVVGWIRVVAIASVFGATRDLDAFYAAFRIPDLIFQLVAAGALASALIPVFSGLLVRNETARAWRVASTVMNLLLLGLAVLGGVAMLAAPALVRAITPGFDDAALSRTVDLTRAMMLSPVMLALGSVATSILNAKDRFAAASAAPIAYNLGIIGGLIFLAPAIGVDGLAIGVVGGSILSLLVQVPSVWAAGFRYAAVVDVRDGAVREALILVAPRAFGLGVSQLTLLVATSVASGLVAGSITVFNVAFTVFQIPIGLVGVPMGIVLLPSMSRQLALGATDEFLSLVGRSLRLILFVTLPIAALAIVLRRPIVALLFQYGQFGQDAVDLTVTALPLFMLALASECLIAVLARAFYAGRDTRTPVAAAVLAVAVNVPLSLVLVRPMGLAGLGLAIAIGSWVEAIVLLALLGRRYPAFDLAGTVRFLIRGAVGAAVCALPALGVLIVLEGYAGSVPNKLGLALELALSGSLGAVTYAGLTAAAGIPEFRVLIDGLQAMTRRRGPD